MLTKPALRFADRPLRRQRHLCRHADAVPIESSRHLCLRGLNWVWTTISSEFMPALPLSLHQPRSLKATDCVKGGPWYGA